jgi:drug/metabolite transporter (DMT)-like permease
MGSRRTLPPWLWLVLLWLVWGTSWPAMRAVFLEMPVWQFRAVTCTLGGLALLALARLGGTRLWPARGDWAPLALASLFNMTIWHVTSGYGLSMIGGGHAAVVCYTMPIWTALLSAAIGLERLGARVLMSLGLGLGGVAVLASHDFAALGLRWLGLVFVLASGISWGIGTVLIKRRPWSVGLNALAGWQLLLGVVPIALVALATERFALHEASRAAIAAAVYTLVVGTIAGYALWFKVVSLFPPTTASIGALVTPVLGVASSALVLGEPVGWRELAALALVLSAVALVIFRPAPKAAPVAAPQGSAAKP